MTPPNCSNCANPACKQDCTASFVLRALDTKLGPIQEDVRVLQEKSSSQEESLGQLSSNLMAQRTTLDTQAEQLTSLQTEVTTATQDGKEQVLKANKSLSILTRRCSAQERRSNNLERAQILK